MDHCEREKRKVNPREKANILSLLTFVYTGSLFRSALKNDLEEKDLYEVIRSCNSKRNGDKVEKVWKKETLKEDTSIARLLLKRFGLKYLLLGLVHLTWKIVKIVLEPYAISNLVRLYKENSETRNMNDVYYYAGILIGHNIFNTFYIHNYIIILQQLSIQIRASFSSLIYRKTLKLTPTAISEISLGNIVTLLTKDVHVFEQAIWMVNDMWIGLIQTCVTCYLLFSKMGLIAFIGVSFLFLVMPFQVYLGKLVTDMRLRTNKNTDSRLQITQETLSAIRIIKMYTWEKFFNDKVGRARKIEIISLLKVFYIKISTVILGILCARLGFYFLIVAYILQGMEPSAELVFYIMTLFRDLRHTLGVQIPYGMTRAADLYASVHRINLVLKGEELVKRSSNDEITTNPKIAIKNGQVKIRQAPILTDINLTLTSGLTLITGRVGSGKSSLLKTMLQDYPMEDGTITSHGSISYASQDPWLFPSSIKQNITFGQKIDNARYTEVIRVCALEYDLSLLDHGDETIVADKGINLSKGQQARINLARAIYKISDIYLLDDSLTALDALVQDFIFDECIKGFLNDKLVVLVTQTTKHLQKADTLIVMDDGKILTLGKPEELSINEITQLVEDDSLEKETPDTPKVIVDEEEEEIEEETKLLQAEQIQGRKKVYSEVNKKGSVSFSVYKRYIAFGGGFFFFSVTMALFIGAQIAESYSDKVLAIWADLHNFTDHFDNSTNEYQEAIDKKESTLRLYSILIFVCTAANLIKHYALFDFCRRASVNMHKAMSQRISYAVMAFFDSHFIGNILNRFSQDLNNIDEHLPFVFTECFRVFFSVLGILSILGTIQWQFVVLAAVISIMLVVLRFLYMPTGRSLKRLEAATRSPLVGHLNSSLEGITTIRAYNAEEILKEEFDRHQDLYTSAHYTMTCTMRAFGFFMDILCSCYIALVVLKLLFFGSDVSAGDVGLVLTQVLSLGGHVQWGIRQWAELENQMTSVERTLEYTEIKQEVKSGEIIANWPSQGAVTFENVNLSYNNNEQVLKNINFSLKPGQKVGIVGRTGAGKSSIISTLFRLYEVEGKIFIDNVNIQNLNLDFLRQSIAIIPQDPVLFSGTLRTNIDPNRIYTDEEIWQALDKVKIKNQFDSLEFAINESGSNFSSGQKQLICLARAIIRKNKIVVLDEATANMDHETDELLHNVIKENFSSCTSFTIAHRLHTILDSDYVMVLDKGEIVEFADPITLLENKEGRFYKMVEQAGLTPQF